MEINLYGEGGQFESDLDIVPVKIGEKTKTYFCIRESC